VFDIWYRSNIIAKCSLTQVARSSGLSQRNLRAENLRQFCNGKPLATCQIPRTRPRNLGLMAMRVPQPSSTRQFSRGANIWVTVRTSVCELAFRYDRGWPECSHSYRYTDLSYKPAASETGRRPRTFNPCTQSSRLQKSARVPGVDTLGRHRVQEIRLRRNRR